MTEREVVGELARALGQGTDLAMVANCTALWHATQLKEGGA